MHASRTQQAGHHRRTLAKTSRAHLHHDKRYAASGDGLCIPRQPVSADALLRAVAVEHLDSIHLKASWFAFIPSRIGHDPTVDAAVTAFVKGNRFAFHCPDASLAGCLRSYVQAVEGQRRLMATTHGSTSDQALLSAALLAHFERSVGQRHDQRDETLQQTVVHLYALQCMLLSRLNAGRSSELDHRIIFGHYSLLLEAPIATGTPSPFERLCLPDPRLIIADAAMTPTVRLSRLAMDLMLHAPRFIAHARVVREGRASTAYLARMMDRARWLLALQDNAAEDALLHSVRVEATKLKSVTPLAPYSFIFSDLLDFDAALNYWHARILIIRVCWNLGLTPDGLDLLEDGRRAAVNILMTWQYGLQRRLFGNIRILHAACSLWGAVADFGVSSSEIPSARPRQALLELVNAQYRPILGERSMEQLDLTAAAYAGGPLQGPLVELYQRLWHVPGVRNTKAVIRRDAMT